MNKIYKYLLMILMIVNFSGCDRMYGINHTNRQTTNPSISCIQKAVLSVSGVSNFKYSHQVGSRPLTSHGIEKVDQIHYYYYKYKNLNGYFYFSVDYEGNTKFSQGYRGINQIPSQSSIDLIRPVMFQIEKNIEGECNLTKFSENIIESCSGIECK